MHVFQEWDSNANSSSLLGFPTMRAVHGMACNVDGGSLTNPMPSFPDLDLQQDAKGI